MKKLYSLLFFAFGLACSCSSPLRDYYDALDRAIENRPVYHRQFNRTRDSLAHILETASSDTARWKAAYAMQSMLIYNNIDKHFIFK